MNQSQNRLRPRHGFTWSPVVSGRAASRSTQLQERRLLKWGAPAFHYGTFAAIAGHVIGVLIPESWTHAIGIPETAYQWFSAGADTLAAVLIIVGW